MRIICSVLSVFLLTCPSFGSLSLSNSAFNVISYATGLSGPLSTFPLGDGSLAISSFAGISRYTGPGSAGTSIYSPASGAHTGIIQVGGYYIDGNSGPNTITILRPGVTPDAQLTPVGGLTLSYSSNWLHSQMGIAARPTPGQPGSFDLVFNVGSKFDHQLSDEKVGLTGLATASLDGDSLYMVTLDLSGAQPQASNLKQVAHGIRNVIGMGFDPANGNFYFADNALDGTGPGGDEPPQAEELNLILSGELGVGAPIEFGYPTCYIQYRTGAQIGSGCRQPLFAFQPLPNGTVLGSESEGVTQLAFAPSNFPAGFNHGIFLGFFGKFSQTGPANEENAVGYYDLTNGSFIHFSENSQDGVYNPIGIMTTADALFISDYGSGAVYEITSAPEPQSLAMISIGLAVLLGARAKRS